MRVVCQGLGFEASLLKASFKNNLDHTEEIRQQVSGFKMSFYFVEGEEERCVLKISFFNLYGFRFISSRWKNSFLLCLVFGLPVMGLMVYMMVMDSQHPEHGGSMPEEQNVLPGLSLLNLAFFLLCTPVQVRGPPPL